MQLSCKVGRTGLHPLLLWFALLVVHPGVGLGHAQIQPQTEMAAKPWMLAVVLFFAAMLLYSQAATPKALMPVALAINQQCFVVVLDEVAAIITLSDLVL